MPVKSLDELTPETKALAVQFLAAANAALKADGLAVWVTETYRPQKRQDELYAQGRINRGDIVTRTRHSRHTQRTAFDVAFKSAVWWKRGVDPYKGHDEAWERIGKIGESLGLHWGGRWAQRDLPHFQVGE